MPCLLALLILLFPRFAIVLLYFFTGFFEGVYNGFLIPLLGFLFLPLTLIVYTYLYNTHAALNDSTSLVALFIAVILDLGLVGKTARGRFRNSGKVC